jgi:hypothetical protein
VDAALNPSRVGTKQEKGVLATGDDFTVTQTSSGSVGGGSIEIPPAEVITRTPKCFPLSIARKL